METLGTQVVIPIGIITTSEPQILTKYSISKSKFKRVFMCGMAVRVNTRISHSHDRIPAKIPTIITFQLVNTMVFHLELLLLRLLLFLSL